MRRYGVMGYAFVCAVALAFVGCRGDDPDYRYYTAEWRVVNDTGNLAIRVVPPPRGDFSGNYDYYTSTPKGWILDSAVHSDREMTFEALLDCWRGWNEANIALEVLGADGAPLKRWNYADRGREGRQFFNPSCWTLTVRREQHEVRHVWTFRLLPEDVGEAAH